MANEGKSNLTPIIIIGGIFLATILGIYWISQSGGDKGANAKKGGNENTSKTSQQEQVTAYNKAPDGANPANFKGGENANIVIEEFADFQCAACAGAHKVLNEISSEYGSRVKIIFRNFPLTSMHKNAYQAAVAAEAAGMQGKFWEMQNLIFINQQKWQNAMNPRNMFEEYAKTIGLDVDKYNTDFAGRASKTRVDMDMKRGNSLGINSTPTLYLNGKRVSPSPPTVQSLRQAIDEELKKFESNDKESDSEDKASDKEDDSSEEKSDKESKSDDKKDEKDEDKSKTEDKK